jgi:hypothetical protein
MAKRGPKEPSKWTKKAIDALADKLIDYTDSTTVPLFCGFCYRNGIREQAISEFSAKNKKFSEAAERMQAKSKEMYIVGGLTEKFNAGMTQFMLVNNHGMKNKTETDLNAKVSHELFIKDAITKSKGIQA